MLMASDKKATESEIYSSWPLENEDRLHVKHLGRLRSTEGARAISLDTYLKSSRSSARRLHQARCRRIRVRGARRRPALP